MRQGQLPRATIARSVAEHLRDEIRRGELTPGTRLRQSDVASRLGVSTTPVREAFALLQADGLVQVDAHRGAVVFRPTVADLLELYDLREALECLAIEKAVPQLTVKALDELDQLVERMRGIETDGEWMELNNSLHLHLYSFSRRPRLCSLIENLRQASRAYIQMFLAHRRTSMRSDDEHAQILAACRAGDVPAAVEALRQHLRHAVREDLRVLETVATLPSTDGGPDGSTA